MFTTLAGTPFGRNRASGANVKRIVLGLLVMLPPASSLAAADEPKLPADGSWVQYEFEASIADKRTMKNVVTLSFVGSAVEEGVACRWIEVKVVVPKGERQTEGTYISKMLVSTEDLMELRDPFVHPLRTWSRRPGEQEAAETKQAFMIGPDLMLWAPAALKTLKEGADRKEVEYQQGRLESARAWVGQRVTVNEKTKSRFESNYTVWMHPDLPIGFAEAVVADNIHHVDGRKLQQTRTYRIQAAGRNAKSELPENN
jgi:hypothetical protein